MTPQQCHRPSRSWRGSGCSQESNEVAVVVTLTTAKAELVSWSMKTRDLKAGWGGGKADTGAQLTFKSGSQWWWLYLPVIPRTQGTGQGQTQDSDGN